MADRLAAAGFSVSVMQGKDAGEAADLARAVVQQGYDALVAMGGDGMVHLALQSVTSSATALGVIPTGTGNDLARCLGLPRRDLAAAADVIAAGATRTIDCAQAGDTYVATVVACGFDSLVSERANAMSWPQARLRYSLATLAELRVFSPLPFTVDLDGAMAHHDAMLVAVGNAPSYGGGLRICEGAALDDGELDVVIIGPMTRVELLRVYPRLFRGTHVGHPAYERHRVKQVSVAAPGIVAYADGERLGPLPLTIRVVPASVTVFAPAA